MPDGRLEKSGSDPENEISSAELGVQCQTPLVLVLGGTGHYGQFVVRSLMARDIPVRVLSRKPSTARTLLGTRPEIIEGDIASPDSTVKALHGVSGVVISISAMHPEQIRRLKAIEQDAVIAVLEQMQRMQVSRVVFISVYDIGQNLVPKIKLESAGIKQAVEEYLARSRLNWTVLGAPPSMQLFFAMIRGSAMMVPGGGPKALVSVSPVDLGEIAAQAVLRGDLSGRRFRVPGPEALSFREAAKRLSAVYGREIEFRKIPLLFSRIAWWLTLPLAPLSDRVFFIHTMLGFIKLLNHFPPEIAVAAAEDHRRLLATFDYTPMTLEMEARRRMKERM